MHLWPCGRHHNPHIRTRGHAPMAPYARSRRDAARPPSPPQRQTSRWRAGPPCGGPRRRPRPWLRGRVPAPGGRPRRAGACAPARSTPCPRPQGPWPHARARAHAPWWSQLGRAGSAPGIADSGAAWRPERRSSGIAFPALGPPVRGRDLALTPISRLAAGTTGPRSRKQAPAAPISSKSEVGAPTHCTTPDVAPDLGPVPGDPPDRTAPGAHRADPVPAPPPLQAMSCPRARALSVSPVLGPLLLQAISTTPSAGEERDHRGPDCDQERSTPESPKEAMRAPLSTKCCERAAGSTVEAVLRLLAQPLECDPLRGVHPGACCPLDDKPRAGCPVTECIGPVTLSPSRATKGMHYPRKRVHQTPAAVANPRRSENCVLTRTSHSSTWCMLRGEAPWAGKVDNVGHHSETACQNIR